MRGVSIERAEEIWQWVIDNQIILQLRPEMLTVIEYHRRKAHRLILISGSFTPLLNELALNLGIEGAIATPLEVNNGRYIGKIIPPLNIGQGKVERLMQFLDGEGQEIDLRKSFLYTDSKMDAPVLEMFGHPIAVHPDPKLAKLATFRGWSVIGNMLH